MNGRSLSRASYNYWIATSGAGTGPFTVQLSDTEGHQATLSGIQLEPGAVQQTSVRMYGSSAGTAGTTAGGAATSRAPAHTTATGHPSPAAIMPSSAVAAPGVAEAAAAPRVQATPSAGPSCR